MVPLSVRNASKIFNHKILVLLNVLLVERVNVRVMEVPYVKIANLEKQVHPVLNVIQVNIVVKLTERQLV